MKEQLQVGQRIDVVNVNEASGYCSEIQKTYIAKIGYDEFCDIQNVSTSFWTNYESITVTPGGFSKVGTFIVNKVKQ